MDVDPHTLLGVEPGASADDLRRARRRLARCLHPDAGGADGRLMAEVNSAYDRLLAASRLAPGPPRPAPPEVASFSVDVLPVEACTLLVAVLAELGDVLDVDEPYAIEAHLDEPRCFCRVDLVPEAGGTSVDVTVDGGAAGGSADAVCDRVIPLLLALGCQ